MQGRHRRSKRVTENPEYAAALRRLHKGLGNRIAADPTMLAHVRGLVESLAAEINRGIFIANRDIQHYSQAEIAAICGISQQAVGKRAKQGEAAYAAADDATVKIAELRAERAAALDAAGLDEATVSNIVELRRRTA